ncbi:MAG: AAA family ATPase [Alphaproteobacteria bacterium]|nr:MAG: AAA family ATPase [Alphaproteobacteria bacterium]
MTAALLPIGKVGPADLSLNLDRLLAGRMLIQGSSGAGKSQLLRVIVEEAFDYVTCMIVDPEGEFGNLAAHIGATTIHAVEISAEGMTAAAIRARHNRLPLHLDLSDLGADERITKAAAFFTGLTDAPREDWANTVLVAVDEAHLLAPHMAASARDGETRRLGVATLTDLCARGRKRGVAPVIATQRLAKLAASVVSELQNVLIGLNVFDRDVARAADLLGFGSQRADDLRRLAPGQFYAIGPALSSRAVMAQVNLSVTPHLGATPDLVGPSDTSAETAAGMLDLAALRETGSSSRSQLTAQRGGRALDGFLLDPAAGTAVRILDALRRIAPNATTCQDLAGHLSVGLDVIHDGLDLLGSVAAADTMPRGDDRIARLSARLRLKTSDTPVVGLA